MRIRGTDGTIYLVHFRYPWHEMGEARHTCCWLHTGSCVRDGDGPCQLTEQYGTATCSPRDEFKKATGRKIALARAMAHLGLEREARAALWTSYLTQVGR